MTDWYSVYHAWKGDRHLDFYRLHQRYGNILAPHADARPELTDTGKVVRFGPNRISVNSAAGLKEIYGSKAKTRKSNFYSVFTHFFDSPSTETTIDVRDHLRKRRALSKALSDQSLKALEGPLLCNVKKFCERLAAGDQESPADTGSWEEWSQPRDMAVIGNCMTFDIMGDFCFGRNFRMMEEPDNRYLMDVISDGAQGLNIVGHMPGLLRLRLDGLLFPRLIRGLHQYKEYSKTCASECLEEPTKLDSRNVFDLLVQENRSGDREALSIAEIISESSLLIIAGSDTTSTAFANTLFHLLNNHDTLTRLNSEVRRTFTSFDQIQTGKLSSCCHYLRACIDEALRLSPPVGGLMPREVLSGGVDIHGQHFPAGVELGVPHYALHHNEAYFKDAFRYKPSRWLVEDGTSAAEVATVQSAFCAFSVGPRGCIGKNMAYMELMVSLASICWLYDMRLTQTVPPNKAVESAIEALSRRDHQTLDKFVSKVRGPVIEFKARRVVV